MTAAAPLVVAPDLRCLPFTKWVGGKRDFVRKHARHLPAPGPGGRYFEPFLGGGAAFFCHYANHRPAILGDLNARLISAYLAVRDQVEELIVRLADYARPEHYTRAHFEAIRGRMNRGEGAVLERAVAFLVVLRWGYNGLYRENGDGDCNVAFGKPSSPGTIPTLCDPEQLRACSRALRGVDIRAVNALQLLAEVTKGDAVFLDPPYDPASGTADFVGYTAAGFSHRAAGQGDLFAGPPPKSAQELLLDAMERIDRAGARFTLTQSEAARARYEGRGWMIDVVKARRSVNSAADKRGPVNELVVRNWK